MRCARLVFSLAVAALVLSSGAAELRPRRTSPRFNGAFKVNLVVISFPDTHKPNPADVQKSLSHYAGTTVEAYYKEFSHGRSWPVLQAYPEVYVAPRPKGYYCRYDSQRNRIGYRGGEGNARAAKLRADALAFCRRLRGAPRGQVEYYVYCSRLNWGADGVPKHLRGAYPKPTEEQMMKFNRRDEIRLYNPEIKWHDPLWPMSVPQGHYPGGSYSLIHELGHVLGAPDFYHKSEEYDGVGGTPALPWAYGPTGMAYCRVIYYGFVPPATYPTYTRDGTYTLDPRASKLPTDEGCDPKGPMPVLGCFIPSSHPNYTFYLEYVHDERRPIGSPGQEGLLIHVVNTTFHSPMSGPPDLCYTYRRGDPYMKGLVTGDAYFREGDVFDEKSDPAAVIPPLIPAGIEIRNIRMADGKCSFDLVRSKAKRPTATQMSRALKPKIALTGVKEVLPTSFRAFCDVRYRGEPLLFEYGFCYGTSSHPTLSRGCFPLYHRDRYDGRILGLKPHTRYYVRAYAKSAKGISYSEEEVMVETPRHVEAVSPLLTDRYEANGYITRHHRRIDSDCYFDSANPMITFMSLGAYYREIVGRRSKAARKLHIDCTRVHTNPWDSRPGFRMHEYHQLYGLMSDLATRAGFRRRDFGDAKGMKEWIRNAAKELGVKNPAKAFFPMTKPEELAKHDKEIRASLEAANPVLLVRENQFVEDVTHIRFPLDVAIIDGYATNGLYHVRFPLGNDRRISGSKSGYVENKSLFRFVDQACLIFVR